METIEELWKHIEEVLSCQRPHQWHQLAPGAPPAKISSLERSLHITFPEDIVASYRRHDGGYHIHLVTDMTILSLEEILDEWHIRRELLDDETWAAQLPYYFSNEIVLHSGWQPGPIQPVWWHQHWIPIGRDTAGNLSCIDLAPAQGGTWGQILDWDHECGPSKVLFSSFYNLLKSFAVQLEYPPEN
jgi:cell wall assembly regulator SMI1